MDAFPTDRQWRLNEDAPLPTQGVTAWPGITQSCMPPDDAEGHVGGGGMCGALSAMRVLRKSSGKARNFIT